MVWALQIFSRSGTGDIDIVDDIVDEFEISGVPGYYGLFSEGILVHQLDKFSTSSTPDSPDSKTRRAQRVQVPRPLKLRVALIQPGQRIANWLKRKPA